MKAISKTAFYCCGARMLDAQSKQPIANDYLAERLMQDEGKVIFRPFKHEWIANLACVVRHKIIDNHVSTFLNHHPKGTIILIGAGFDTRAYRHKGGHWFELDEYQLITYKNQYLPTSECQNPLQRYSVDFSNNELTERLRTINTPDDVLFIIEGVFMYLDATQIEQLLNTLTQIFPQHQIVCDLLTKRFQQLFGKSIQRKIKAMGNNFIPTKSPNVIFQDHHYQLHSYTSIVLQTIQLKVMPIPLLLGKTLLPLIKNGYGIYHFHKNT